MDDPESTEGGSSNMHDSTGRTYGLSRSINLPIYIKNTSNFTSFSFIDNEKIIFILKEKVSKLTNPTSPYYLTMIHIMNSRVCIKYTNNSMKEHN